MSIILGIDAGGTYTDGVLLSVDDKRILKSYKTPTLHHDLVTSIRLCIQGLSIEDVSRVTMVCLSSTLATNAIVERGGASAGLILIGHRPEGTLPSSHIELVEGKMDLLGRVQVPLNMDQVDAAIDALPVDVQAIAVSGYASTRNPDHELLVRERILQRRAIPVICAHELTSSLGFYQRTVTAALNARLVPLLCDLIDAVERVLLEWNLRVPFMIVRGDGSLMSSQQARQKPIETILSGPAASIAGGRFLSSLSDAYILDMGGTTTDISRMLHGAVPVSRDGANVGGWMTSISAASIYTAGLGGDSRLRFTPDGQVVVMPERIVPFCVAAAKSKEFLDELRSVVRNDTCSANCIPSLEAVQLNTSFPAHDAQNRLLLEALQDSPHTLYHLSHIGVPNVSACLENLIANGTVSRIAFTPTDILHAQGSFSRWCNEASRLVISYYARHLRISDREMMQKFQAAVAGRLIDVFTSSMSFFSSETAPSAAKEAGLPIVAIGAPASAWASELQNAFHTKLISPAFADVAGAVGTAVGHITESEIVLIRFDSILNRYIVFSSQERKGNFSTLAEATAYGLEIGSSIVRSRLPYCQGQVSTHTEDQYVTDLQGQPVFVERRLLFHAVSSLSTIQ